MPREGPDREPELRHEDALRGLLLAARPRLRAQPRLLDFRLAQLRLLCSCTLVGCPYQSSLAFHLWVVVGLCEMP